MRGPKVEKLKNNFNLANKPKETRYYICNTKGGDLEGSDGLVCTSNKTKDETIIVGIGETMKISTSARTPDNET